MYLLKLSKLTWVITKNWIYYLIASYLLGNPINNITVRKYNKPAEVYKNTKWIMNKAI